MPPDFLPDAVLKRRSDGNSPIQTSQMESLQNAVIMRGSNEVAPGENDET